MVEFLEYEGKKYPIFLSTFVFGKIQMETGYGFEILSEIMGNDDASLGPIKNSKIYLYEPLIWHCLVEGHLVAREKLELKREDMPLFLSNDKMYTDFISLVPKFLPKSAETSSEGKKK